VTISFVAAGTAATGNNASVAPALPAGVAAGDLLLAVASIRNSGTGTVTGATGWAHVSDFGNLSVLGRYYTTGLTAPTITFAGGVANADTIARIVALRGVAPDQLAQAVSATLLNGSGQNITYPALDVPEDKYALLMALWKQDDATSLTTPAGWTAVGLTATTTGDDALQALFYQIQTTEADITSSSSTVTGGTAAISRGLLLALKPAAAIAVNVQDVYPPRVQVSVTGLTIGDSLAIYRSVAGQLTLVRGATFDAVTDTAVVVVDAELPFGVPVLYTAVADDTATYSTAASTYDLPGGKAVLSDAITGAAAEVVVQSIGDQAYTRGGARLRAGGRNIVVTGPAGQAEGSYVLYTEAFSAFENLLALLASATEAIVQLRQPGISALSGDPYDGVDAFLAVDAWSVARYSADGSDGRRLTTIQFAVTDGWASTLQNQGYTYDDMSTFYTSGTYADVGADFTTYLDLAQGDFS
jgi:hypothetical protein